MISTISALLEGLSLADLDTARPVQRQRFAALCRHCWQLRNNHGHDTLLASFSILRGSRTSISLMCATRASRRARFAAGVVIV